LKHGGRVPNLEALEKGKTKYEKVERNVMVH